MRELVSCRSENPKLLDDAGAQEAGRGRGGLPDRDRRPPGRRSACEIDRFEALPGRDDVVGTARGRGRRPLADPQRARRRRAGRRRRRPGRTIPGAARSRTGELWGRGSCDMKGGIAAGIVALRALRDRSACGSRGDVVFQSVVDEETGGPGTRAALERGHSADAAIVLEPTAARDRHGRGRRSSGCASSCAGAPGHSAHPLPLGPRGRAGRRRSTRSRRPSSCSPPSQELERHWARTQGAPAHAERASRRSTRA